MKRIAICLGLVVSFIFDLQGQTGPMVTESKSTSTQEQVPLDQSLNWARGHQTFKDLHYKQHEAEFVRLVKEGQSPQTLFHWMQRFPGCSRFDFKYTSR